MSSSFSGFLSGAFLALILIAVNHRRIHRDDVRKTVFDAVLNTRICASEYWSSDYEEKKKFELIGSMEFLYRMMPLSKFFMNENQIIEMDKRLSDLIDALMGKEEMNEVYHRIDSNRISAIHTISGIFLKEYYAIYLKQTNIITLTVYPRKVQNLWIWLKSPDKNPQFKNGGA